MAFGTGFGERIRLAGCMKWTVLELGLLLNGVGSHEVRWKLWALRQDFLLWEDGMLR